MDVRVDEHRYHGLAGEVHARGAGGHANVGGPAGLHDPAAVHEQGRVLDRGATVARDQARAFERRDAGRRRLTARWNSEPGNDSKGNGCGDGDCVHSAHRGLHDENWTTAL